MTHLEPTGAEVLERACTSTAIVLAAVRVADFDLPTPCRSWTVKDEDVPAFVELESGGPPPGACRVVGVGQPPSHPTKERGPP